MRRRRDAARTGTSSDWLIVGLGNPGKEYELTRHNVGAEAVNLLADRHGAKLRNHKERALVDEVRMGEQRVALAIPTTYMNDSGDSLRRLVKRFGVEPEQVIVIHDELDLPVAQLRMKVGGGVAGHNGLRSIKSHLHSDKFLRIRIGVGKPASKEHGADYVLKKFSPRERNEIDVTLAQSAAAAELIVTQGIDAAMNQLHGNGG
ncbi:MAG: aminoacyl-tRNA hydrolase [Actinobacteria bacterium]|nr:aminoacyl-tRNA hydrolase [Actinomycetota bacterium]MSV94805.1 aminoacyl-tRNA hydrolase [Actinomycetota bacterium]MSW61108.1 aminoacyl-tRNA hydrolase [Actinomycetota bacterium]MSY44330.1 aminoacyl-tRNA hydrolase [Actinomycetota bacterium]